MPTRAISWLLRAQGEDGGWGGDRDTPPSIEETALATETLAELAQPIYAAYVGRLQEEIVHAAFRGTAWLIHQIDQHGPANLPAAPIGFYFARLWYYERLYPLILATAAIGRTLRLIEPERA
jgi:squalene-hopene/tetraprenyl-beta-curcumene cyclase